MEGKDKRFSRESKTYIQEIYFQPAEKCSDQGFNKSLQKKSSTLLIIEI